MWLLQLPSGPAARVCGGFSASRNAGPGPCSWRGRLADCWCAFFACGCGSGCAVACAEGRSRLCWRPDRLAGRLSEAEYSEHKAAFDVVLRRALVRASRAWRVLISE